MRETHSYLTTIISRSIEKEFKKEQMSKSIANFIDKRNIVIFSLLPFVEYKIKYSVFSINEFL
jgi:hypothetical protein